MCDRCEQFSRQIKITSSRQLQELHSHLYFDGVKPGILEITDGLLQFDNEGMACVLRCRLRAAIRTGDIEVWRHLRAE